MTPSKKKKLGYALFIILSIVFGPDMARKTLDMVNGLPVMESRS
jgi:hypothetical protein